MKETKIMGIETLVIVCRGGCGKTTEQVSCEEFWSGRIEASADPEELAPEWTFAKSVSKRR